MSAAEPAPLQTLIQAILMEEYSHKIESFSPLRSKTLYVEQIGAQLDRA